MKELIIKHNQFINCNERPTLTALERKIVLKCMIQVTEESINDVVIVTAKDILNSEKLTASNRRDIDRACEKLAGCLIKEENQSSKKYRPIFKEIVYIKESSEVRFIFNELNHYLIINLTQNFSTYEYRQIGDLKNTFAIRIYEFLIQGKNKYRERIFSVIDFLNVLSVGEGSVYYRDFGAVKRKILDRSCKEITEKTDINCQWEVHKKKGRKVTDIKFTWEFKVESHKVIEEKSTVSNEVIQLVKKLNDVELDYSDIIMMVKKKLSIDITDLEINQILNTSSEPEQLQEQKPTQPIINTKPKPVSAFQDKLIRLEERFKEIGLDKDVIKKGLERYQFNPTWKVWPEVNGTKLAMKEGRDFPNKHTLKKFILEGFES